MRPYLPIQYPLEQQKISHQEPIFIPTYLLVHYNALTDQFTNLPADQAKFVSSVSHLMCFGTVRIIRRHI